MTNVTQAVRDFLNKHPFIVKGLHEGIINVSALALYIMDKMGIDATVHAVISAIRRYESSSEAPREEQPSKAAEVFKDSKISTKSRLTLLTVARHFDQLQKILPAILENVDVSRGEVLRIVEGRGSIKFLVDHSKEKEIIKLIPRHELLSVSKDLGEINILFPEKLAHMPGLIAPVLNELEINDIDPIEVISCLPEFLIIVKENQIAKCHDTLLRFFYGN